MPPLRHITVSDGGSPDSMTSLDAFCGKVIRASASLVSVRRGIFSICDGSGSSAIDGQCGFAQPSAANLWTPPYAYALQTAAAAKAGADKLN